MPLGIELGAQRVEVLDEPFEPGGVDTACEAVLPEKLRVPIELLEHVGAHVAAADDRQDLEQAADGGARSRNPWNLRA